MAAGESDGNGGGVVAVEKISSRRSPSVGDGDNGPSNPADNADQLKRHLGQRQIHMIAIGGSIGTALFVSIAGGLRAGGPGSLLVAYIIYSVLLALVNSSVAEMCVYMPVSGSFIRMAGKWVDDAFGFMAGWNFFLYEAAMIPFEISALNLVLQYWRQDFPVGGTAAVCVGCIVLYGIINVFGVRYYGEAEFWLSSGKLLLILILFGFTFVTMVGGNPRQDAYGFRYWKEPGSFAEYIHEGTLGRFQGFLGALWSAAFTIVGPEYVATVAGETQRPRTYLKQAFKTVYWRFGFFFIGGALCIGIVLPYNDTTLKETAGLTTASASPYVIAMQNMGVTLLPDITNALMVTSIFSAGNAYTYCAIRSLYGLALEGQAPAFLKKCTKQGVPIWCYAATMSVSLLSFLCLSQATADVVQWLANLTEASQLITYIVMSITYIFFHRALRAQGVDRSTLSYRGWGQPHVAYAAAICMTIVVACYGYETFLPGSWDVGTFFSYYAMVFVAVLTFGGWKIVKGTTRVSAADADLVWDRPIIDAYEDSLKAPATGFWGEMLQMMWWSERQSGAMSRRV